jgi:transcriptional regulator with XRE-family HTH domain
MSTDRDDEELTAAGVPELTPLGKRIELLRMERRMSKRILAHRAGTSRQQLWRVMTGKSELTSSLCARLSEVLEIDSRVLREATALESGRDAYLTTAVGGNGGDSWRSNRIAYLTGAAVRGAAADDSRLCQTLEDYISGPRGLERTFETLPITEDGRRLKRVLLDAIEDIAIERGLKLPQSIFDLRRAIVNDDR